MCALRCVPSLSGLAQCRAWPSPRPRNSKGPRPWVSQLIASGFGQLDLQGSLAHKKQRHPRTLQLDYASGSMVALGGCYFLRARIPCNVCLGLRWNGCEATATR